MKKSRLALIVFVPAVAAGAVTLLPLRELILDVLAWAQGFGVWGPVVVAAAYAAASLFLIPGSLLTIGSGLVFGFGPGLLAVIVGSNLGAAGAFLAGRTLARPWVERQITAEPRVAAIDRAVAEHALKIVLLLRLSPVVPFGMLNYVLSVTRVSFAVYVLATFLGMLPATFVYIYLGTLLKDLTELGTGRPWTLGQRVLFVAGLAATVAAMAVVARTARAALRSALGPAESTKKTEK